MGIGPSTKETSLHHFRDPLLEVVAEDTDLDLLGLIIVGTPDDNKDKMLVGTRAAAMAECMRADGVIITGILPISIIERPPSTPDGSSGNIHVSYIAPCPAT